MKMRIGSTFLVLGLIACGGAIKGALQKANIISAGEGHDDVQEKADEEMDDVQEAALEKSTIRLTGKETAQQRQALAKVTSEAAQAEGLKHVPGGSISRVDLDDENGYLVYSIDILKDGLSNDVKIDAGNGRFLYIDTTIDAGREGRD